MNGYIRHRRNFTDVQKDLRDEIRGAGITIRYTQREPPIGRGSLHGIRASQVLVSYQRALEWALRRLTLPPISLRAPTGAVVVYCSEISEWKGAADPITFDHNARPAIALPSRTTFVTSDHEQQYMVSSAAHEMGHAVCASQPGMGSVIRMFGDQWQWLAEATSVWLETLLASKSEATAAGLPKSFDWLFYMLDWCDYPEVPVDAPDGYYQAAQFLRYLVGNYGEGFVGELWRASNAAEPSWPLIEKLAGKTADALFADYAGHAYLLNDRRSKCYFPNIYRRFGGRAVTESFHLAPGECAVCKGEVWPLGCRYFRIYGAGAGSVHIDWDGSGPTTITAGAATPALRGVGKTVGLDHAGTVTVLFGGAENHVWIAVCGEAGSGQAHFSFPVRAR